MKYLLDTHVLIWFFTGDEKLPKNVRTLIESDKDNFFYSPASIYEIDNKRSKHPDKISSNGAEIVRFCEKAGIEELPFTEKHALELVNLKRYDNTPPHNDPFDKMMLCQAVAENMRFITHDNRIAEYDCINVYKI